MSLEECLPPELRRADTKIAPIAMGFSGAAVYRVDAGGRSFVLKLARADETEVHWRHALRKGRWRPPQHRERLNVTPRQYVRPSGSGLRGAQQRR